MIRTLIFHDFLKIIWFFYADKMIMDHLTIWKTLWIPECIVFDIMRILLAFSYFSTFSETRRYGPVRNPVPAEDFSLWLMLFLPFGKKNETKNLPEKREEKKHILLVLPIEEISLWPELSSPPHLRIQGGYSECGTVAGVLKAGRYFPFLM